MGCNSSSAQLDNVQPPKHNANYIDPSTNKEVPLLQIPEAHSAQQIQTNTQIETQPFELSPSPKKQQERVLTAATEQLKHQPMKHVPEGKAFIFGQSQNERKIVLLDCEKMQFSILSNRSQAPSTPHKYQPKDIIFEQSQELQASNLFNTNSHPPYNFMYITFINDQTIFLCGGVNYNFDYVSEQSFFFRVHTMANEELQTKRRKGGNNLVGNKFERLSFMKNKRYSHMGAYFQTGKLGYIYVFGGRGEDQQILTSCEQYSIEEKKWREITHMNKPRSTGFSLIFKAKIYIFGGYSADKKRSKSIQVYDPFKNYWEQLNVKLHRGIEAGLIFSLKPNQILIMGGNMQQGCLKSVIKMNLSDLTYIWDSNMKNQRLLQKGTKYNDSIFIFGGDFQDNFQRYTPKDRKWKDHQFSYNEFISIDDINSYQMASETVEVQYDQTILSKVQNNNNNFERFHIFGNDNYPCILELNLNKFVLKKKAVPMVLRLRSNMGVAKVMEGKYFICGGVDSVDNKPSRASYLYYAGTNKTIEVQKMASKKYQFAICATHKYVYIFGGKNQSGQMLNECQKYSFDEQKWIKVANLPTERINAQALVIGTKIFIFGGSDTLQTVSSIDIFDMDSDTFWNSKQSLSMSSDIKSVFLDTEHADTPAVYILSHNEVLSKYFCHYLVLNIPLKNQENQLEKIQQNFDVIRDIQEQELNLKVLAYNHAFFHNKKMNIITSKGLFSWQAKNDQKGEYKFENQIVINQVEMLQFPIQKFSSS